MKIPSRTKKGNVYLCDQAIVIYSPQGQKLATIPIPEPPTNVTFGGPENNLLFITARTGFYALEMNLKGHPHAIPPSPH